MRAAISPCVRSAGHDLGRGDLRGLHAEEPGGDLTPVEDVYTPRVRARPWRESDLHPHDDRRPATTGGRRAGYARRGGLYEVAHHRYSDRDRHLQLRAAGRRSRAASADPARELGRVAARPAADDARRRRPGAVLPAAVARQRQHAARLQQLALPRSPQPAAVGRVAMDSEPAGARHGAVLRRGHGRQPARTRSRSTTWSPTSAWASAFTRRWARRCGSNWPRATRACGWSSPRARHFEDVWHAQTSDRRVRDCAAGAPHRGRAAVRRRPPLLRRRPDRPRARHAGRVRRPGVGHRPVHRSGHESVRASWRSRAGRSRAQRQHHRRSAGFELVHQPDPGAAAERRRTGARPAHRERTGARAMDRHRAEEGRASRPGSRSATREARCGSSPSTPPGIPRRPPARLSWPTGSSGPSATGRPRTIWSPSSPPTSSSANTAVFTPVSGKKRPMKRRDLDDVFRRAHQSRRRLPRRRRPRPAGTTGRRVPLLRHPSRRSQRRRPARTPARAAGAESVRRMDQSGGHEGRQHARHRRHRERPRHRSTLSAGCRLDVRHRRQRSARVRRGLGVSLRRRPDAEAAGDGSASSSSRGRPSTMSRIRRSAGSKARSSIRPDGSHESRQRRCCGRAPTTISGRRGASRRSPTR